jgi:hypothetical protein
MSYASPVIEPPMINPAPTLPLPPASPATPLPKTLILSYIGRDTSAPRLRRIITWSLRTIATVHAMLALAILCFTASALYDNVQRFTMFGRRTPILDALSDSAGLLTFVIPLLILLLAGAITFFCCARPASRGSRAAAVLITLCLLPLLFILPVITAVLCGIAILNLRDPHPNHSVAAAFLLLPITILLVLLLKDLITCITWASTNPAEEKPRTPFLPSKSTPPPKTIPNL